MIRSFALTGPRQIGEVIGVRKVCRRENVTYEIMCVECESRCVGETARNAHTRIREHLSALQIG